MTWALSSILYSHVKFYHFASPLTDCPIPLLICKRDNLVVLYYKNVWVLHCTVFYFILFFLWVLGLDLLKPFNISAVLCSVCTG